ncbi:MAG: 3-oxoacyl-ACP reductase FabG [Bryobacterales bacterium]|jgi:3-oxoacyl-[acyl-carrier protein] reductase|nr:3-oxoacyl-ACP reductase FabG [Bryobacterales bacterium]
MSELEGRVALVTGASRGIGRAVALRLGEAGCAVAVNYLNRRAEAEEAAAGVRALGVKAVAIQADVRSAGDVLRLAGTTTSELGAPSILVNNAGISRVQPLAEITEQDWDETVGANLKSAFLVTQAVLAGMRRQGWGRIVMISSVAAHLGGVVGPHYAASKAGMIGMAHFYARALVKEGIAVNSVSPALIETEMVKANPNARADIIPAGRFGQPDEVADAVLMLVRNGYITGQTIHVNGGWYMS